MLERLTPLLQQYHKVKERYQDTILLFRMGDFYEMFYDDAKIGAQVLGLTLTSRSHGKSTRVPLAGVPVKSIDTYIARLVQAGLKVAVCEQLEQPGIAKLIKRDVIEVITPGTVLRPTLLEARKNSYLLAVVPDQSLCGIAFADLSTAEFNITQIPLSSLNETIQKIDPKEIILPQTWENLQQFVKDSSAAQTRLDPYYFSYDYAFEKLTQHFAVHNLDGFGIDDQVLAVQAAGAIHYYLEQTQKNNLPHFRRISTYQEKDYLLIDKMTRKNLELTERIRDNSSQYTLLSVLDQTKTPIGARLIRRWLLAPLLNTGQIKQRQDSVSELISKSYLLKELREIFADIGDLERNASRIAVERCNGRDIIALKNWLKKIPLIREQLNQTQSALLQHNLARLEEFTTLVQEIEKTLNEEQPLTISEGGLIKTGYLKELDELRSLASNAKEYIVKLQAQERQKTGIPNLRVSYNSVFGYYIEITKSHLHLVPKHYIRKQTLVNNERYITPELKEYENKVLNAEERIKTLEYELFVDLRKKVALDVVRILAVSQIISELDVLASLAKIAIDNNYIKPEINETDLLQIIDGRHPVIEKLVLEPFIPNDTNLDLENNQILLITGPNMAGKSTYLRQVALIVIMAQIGSFVPAKHAKIGVVDKIFTRIGASDDLSRGVSTFLAEMSETANILNNATPKSLVILDEIGRGTATYDGLAIAWAVVEYLHQNQAIKPKTLFATHYHELTDIIQYLPRVKNYNFLAKESEDTIIFLRKLVPGKADKSYGIAVAKLAGLPHEVIERAKIVLEDFERGEELSVKSLGKDKQLQISLFQPIMHPLVEEIRNLNLEQLTPLQALNLLDRIKEQLGKTKE
ncbi:MAG: DNA mismatch repair protein MutS [Candidatus Latescibacteria bacterium]|nr:DNA mismatch repair protein MutS [Candidatus Latescibacterota bacterium]